MMIPSPGLSSISPRGSVAGRGSGPDGASPFSLGLVVPSKAMLFGEYGVLYGGPALVATLPHPRMVFEAEILSCARLSSLGAAGVPMGQESLRFWSPMVAAPISFGPDGEALDGARRSQGPVRFIAACLGALAGKLHTLAAARVVLSVRVTEEIAPELGLGSSSALLVGLAALVNRAVALVAGEDNRGCGVTEVLAQESWHQLLGCLRAAQGRGSGYDLAAQSVAAHWMDPVSVVQTATSPGDAMLEGDAEVMQGRLWTFVPAAAQLQGGGVPQLFEWVEHPFWNQSGWLLPSGIAAATGAVLGAAGRREEEFAERHSALANEALKRLGDRALWSSTAPVAPFAELCDAALALAREQGIADHARAGASLDLLRAELAYKTMGAGCGDCLWIVPRRQGPEGHQEHCTGVRRELPKGAFKLGCTTQRTEQLHRI